MKYYSIFFFIPSVPSFLLLVNKRSLSAMDGFIMSLLLNNEMIPNTVYNEMKMVSTEREYLHTANMRKKKKKICLFLFLERLGIFFSLSWLCPFPQRYKYKGQTDKKAELPNKICLKSKSGI